MDSTPISDITFLGIVGFIVIATSLAAAHGAPVAGRAQALMRTLLVGIVWLGITAAPPLLGWVGPDGFLPPQLLMTGVLSVAVLFALSKTGGRIARAVPLWALVGFQGFRLPLELVLHRWAEVGIAPPQMTWTGQNPDIVSGGLALLAIPLVRKKASAAWLPTVVGLALLFNIGRIVATSLPGPLQRFPEALTLPFRFPHVWIGSVCVAGALAAHLITIRALRSDRASL